MSKGDLRVVICNHLLADTAPPGLEVVRISDDRGVSCHIYMEAQIFTPDSKRLIFQRSGNPHGSDINDPTHKFVICDIEDRCRLMTLTEEIGATAISISPDGKYAYYFVIEGFELYGSNPRPKGGRLTLKRVRMDGCERETLMSFDAPELRGPAAEPFDRVFPRSSISADGKRLAFPHGKEDLGWGLLIFNLESGQVSLALEGPTWTDMHPQYNPVSDPACIYDILVQHNHHDGAKVNVDVHVVRDDGANLRTLAWGRNGTEYCQGHQCWRGRTGKAITSLTNGHLIEGSPVPDMGHLGANTPGAQRNDLTWPNPGFAHFATDVAGTRIISDFQDRKTNKTAIVLADLPDDPDGHLQNVTTLLYPQTKAHAHPFLSPDGSMGFFNSDESGILQAYMVRGF